MLKIVLTLTAIILNLIVGGVEMNKDQVSKNSFAVCWLLLLAYQVCTLLD